MKKTSIFVFSVTALTAICFGSAPAALAQSNANFQVQSIKSTATDVTVSWSGGADHYAVYRDGELVYQGSETSFKLTNLAAHTDSKLRVVAYDANGKEIGKSKVQVGSKDATPPSVAKRSYKADATGQVSFKSDTAGNVVMDHGEAVASPTASIGSGVTDVATYVDAAVNANSVVLSWTPVPGVKSYEILRDGAHLATVTSGEFTDKTAQSGKEYRYEVKAFRLMDSARTQELDKFVQEHALNLTEEQKQYVYNDSVHFVKKVNTSLDTTVSSVVSPDTPYFPYYLPSFWLEYTCFIKDKYVSNPWDAAGTATYSYFGGDDRDFDPYSNAFRTRSTQKGGFGSAGQSIGMTPEVGLTTGYDSNYKLIGTGRASSSGITMRTPSLSSSVIKYTIDHAVGNPLTSAPDIDYSFTASWYSDGHLSMSGWHDRAPHHEVYLFDPYFETMHTLASYGLSHLAPPYANENWSFSNL